MTLMEGEEHEYKDTLALSRTGVTVLHQVWAPTVFSDEMK